MKKIVFAFLCLFIIAGCSDDDPNNELILRNSSLAAVTVNFRGTHYPLTVGQSEIIRDIPNGTYAYETAVSLPSGATSVTKGTHLDDTLQFTGETKYTIFYIGTLLEEVYEINATLSTTNQEEAASRLLP
ncbi:MAG: hypothetical protein PHD29_05610 [bacterium]|nr:hypothetical protein [bacterium]MDD5353615.1 hypothetical protein [bacterium]MDD5757200.1 hypothetical protein [bacterium]